MTVSKAKAKRNGTYIPNKVIKLTHFTKIDSGWYK
jgi:hypothetical protein